MSKLTDKDKLLLIRKVNSFFTLRIGKIAKDFNEEKISGSEAADCFAAQGVLMTILITKIFNDEITTDDEIAECIRENEEFIAEDNGQEDDRTED